MSGPPRRCEIFSREGPGAGPDHDHVRDRSIEIGRMRRRFLIASRHISGPLLWIGLLTSGLLLPSLPEWGHAQVTPPITASGLNTTVTKSGPVYDITGGTRPGSGPNLFHSFGEFGVPTSTIANFVNETALPTTNILSRVTGGQPSNIFGTLQTTGFGAANLFLMNPAGIVFGPTASLNVGGSVSFTTADYLRLADGATFQALPASLDTSITNAPVAAFGFLGSNPGAITVQGGRLAVTEGQGISLVGGNIEVVSGTLGNGASQPTRLSAPGGQITLAAVGSPGEIAGHGAATPFIDSTLSGFSALGTISLGSGTVLTTSAPSAGRIVIRSGQFNLEGATLEAHATATGHASSSSSPVGGISVQAENMTLSHGSNVLTSAVDGTPEDIRFEVGTLRSNVGTDGLPLADAAPVTIASTSTGRGGAGSMAVTGQAGRPADALLLSNTQIVTDVTNAADPTMAPGNIAITAQQMELSNGTAIRADTTGGADAGAITLNVATLSTRAGPDGRVFFSSSSNCDGCFGGQAGDITIQGLPGITSSSTRTYKHITTPNSEPDRSITYHFARDFDIRGTDIHSDAIGHAPGGKVIMRTDGRASFDDSHISVATQDYTIEANKPNGQPARYQGFSNIDIMAKDIVLQDSTIRADALVSDIGACPLCQGGPSAGEIWLRPENSLIATNSSITNTSRGRAQAGITKIVGDHHFSEGALWDTLYPDRATGLVALTNSEVTVEAQHSGLPGYLRIRADRTILDHSIVNSKANDVSNVKTLAGELIDVVGAGERSVVVSDGRSVQGSLLLVAESLDIIGGGIIAPTQGTRVASRMDLQVDNLTTRPGTGPGGTLDAPRILNPNDPTRVVISSSSTGAGGAGTITISGRRQPALGSAPLTPAKSIRLNATDLLTDTRIDALGGKIELNSGGPIELRNATISSNVHDVRARSAAVQDPGGNIILSAGTLSLHEGEISALSTGTQTGGNIVLNAREMVTVHDGARITASSSGSGNAGHITINAGEQFSSQNGSITTDATQASGGNITIQAIESIRLVNSQLSTSVKGGPNTSGGNILLDPAVVTMQNSQVLAQAVEGQGGNISIIAGTFLADPSSVVSASSQFGLSGAVSIQSPVSSLSNTLATLPQRPLQAQPLAQQRCAAQAYGQLSSFVVEGRDTLPSEPGGWLMSPFLSADADSIQSADASTRLHAETAYREGAIVEQVADRINPLPPHGVQDLVPGCRS